MGKQKAVVMVCDNPECSTRRIYEPSEPALGYYFGKGAYHFDGGGLTIPDTYACSKECILPAITHNIQEAWG